MQGTLPVNVQWLLLQSFADTWWMRVLAAIN
jgi:hypothetical protein